MVLSVSRLVWMILLGCIKHSIVITYLDKKNVGSGFGEGEGNGFPDAPGAAGDERGMAFEGEHVGKGTTTGRH